MFALHERLKVDTFPIAQSALSSGLLMNNEYFPWLILVPRVNNASEIVDLSAAERQILMEEITFASKAMQQLFSPDKLNVASLGNQVSQLHVHIIARFKKDRAWPNPVWGMGCILYASPKEIIIKIQKHYEAETR